MNVKDQKSSSLAIRLPLYIGSAIAFGIFLGAQMSDGTTMTTSVNKNLMTLKQILTHIENDYVDEVDTDELIEGTIEEMLSRLDPHTTFISAEEMKLAHSELQGNFEGIGVEFNIFRDTIYVIAPLSGGPSEKLGILSGDRIVKVNGENIAGTGLTTLRVMKLLRGPKGSEVDVSIFRKGQQELLDFTIERDVIPEFSINVSYMVDEEIGYIKVGRFSATTFMEFKEHLGSLTDSGMTKLILDLTGNPGGYMDRAIDMVDEFLEGNKLIVYTEGQESRYNDQHFSHKKGDFESGPLIVLIDEGSASASEIVSGALQDHDRALIVGRRSYGKGLVQMPISLHDGSQLRLVISRYYTPSGRHIQKPYDADKHTYQMEYMARFDNGEVFNADSMYVNDTLVYKTEGGRTVYGGGGIIPDHFVPYDTSHTSKYLTRLFNSYAIHEFALDYGKQNREELETMGLRQFVRDFEIPDQMMDQVVKKGVQNGVPFDEDAFKRSEDQIKVYIKAYIGRAVWDNDGFFPVLNRQNEIFLKALELFDEAETLAFNQDQD